MVDAAEVNLVRETAPRKVRFLKWWILAVGVTTQTIFVALGCWYLFLDYLRAAMGADCYYFNLDHCRQIIQSWPSFLENTFILFFNVFLFVLPSMMYLLSVISTLWNYYKPPERSDKMLIPSGMVLALFPTAYYYMVIVYWHCAAVDRALHLSSPTVSGRHVALTTFGLVAMSYVSTMVVISTALCDHLYVQTIKYVKLRERIQRDVEVVE